MGIRKQLILFLLYSLYFAVAVGSLVRQNPVMCHKEYEFEGHQGNRLKIFLNVFEDYVFKFRLNGVGSDKDVNGTDVLLNNRKLKFFEYVRKNDTVRLQAYVQANRMNQGSNTLEIAPFEGNGKVSISNYRKIYAGTSDVFIPLYYGKGNERGVAAQDLMIGVVLAIIWVGLSLLLSLLLAYPLERCFCVNLYGLFIMALTGFMLSVISRYGIGVPLFVGSHAGFAVYVAGLILVKSMEILTCGRNRLFRYAQAIGESIKTCESRYHLSVLCVCFLVCAYMAFFFSLQIIKHRGFMPSMDFGMFMQLFHNGLHGRLWEVQDYGGNLISFDCYHLQPMLYLFLPFYYALTSNLTIYFLQTSCIALGALPLFFIARKVFNSSLCGVLASFVYMLYPSLHNCTMYGFHFEEISIPLILCAFYALMQRKRYVFVVCCLLIICLKENLAGIAFMLGVYAFFRKEKAAGSFIALVSAVWLYLCVFVIVPLYSPATGHTYLDSFFGNLGQNRTEIITNLFCSFPSIIKSICNDESKIYFLYHIFAPLGFLSLCAPDILIVGLPTFAQILISNYSRFCDVTIFYQSSLIPVLMIASIYGIKRISGLVIMLGRMVKMVIPLKTCAGCILLLVLFDTAYYAVKNVMPKHSPWYFSKEAYSISARDRIVKKYLDQVPADASVAFPHRYSEYLGPRRFIFNIWPQVVKSVNPEIVIVDAYPCWPSYYETKYIRELIEYLEGSKKYHIQIQDDGFYLFERDDVALKMGYHVYDYTYFKKEYNSTANRYEYACAVVIPDDGTYEILVRVNNQIVDATTETRGYDSFEFLPSIRGVARIAQRFCPRTSRIDKIEILARRIGSPILNLTIVEDVNGKPSEKEIMRIVGKKQAGTHAKYSWISYGIEKHVFDPAKKYWFILDALPDNPRDNRYEIACFNGNLKPDYKDSVLYQYEDAQGLWGRPYHRDNRIIEEDGNDIDGVVYRIISEFLTTDDIVLTCNGAAVQPEVMRQNLGDITKSTCYSYTVQLHKGRTDFAVSSGSDFQLENMEIIKK